MQEKRLDTLNTIAACRDTEFVFDIGDEVQEKDCQWLVKNRVHGDFDLCDYDHIAFRCPLTCDACDLLQADEREAM